MADELRRKVAAMAAAYYKEARTARNAAQLGGVLAEMRLTTRAQVYEECAVVLTEMIAVPVRLKVLSVEVVTDSEEAG